jgi:hypothetical protein
MSDDGEEENVVRISRFQTTVVDHFYNYIKDPGKGDAGLRSYDPISKIPAREMPGYDLAIDDYTTVRLSDYKPPCSPPLGGTVCRFDPGKCAPGKCVPGLQMCFKDLLKLPLQPFSSDA